MAAGAIQTWLSGALVRQLNATWPFVKFSDWSEACERGDATEYTWQQYHANPQQASHLTALRSFIAAAFHQPRLRALFPFTSHDNLGFRPTVRPIDALGVIVCPVGDDRYQVRETGRREVGIADAAGSVELVLTVLDKIAKEQSQRTEPASD